MSHFQPTVVASTSYPAEMFPIILQLNDWPDEKYAAKNHATLISIAIFYPLKQ